MKEGDIETIKSGSIVKLKSGGPKMSVMYSEDVGSMFKSIFAWRCSWFANENELKSNVFTPEQLILSNE